MGKAIVINMFGGPGVGKSTFASGVFSLLKLHDVECELATEFAKELVWEERYDAFKDQQFIFGEQHHRIWRLRNKVNVIITDCPLILSSIYGYRYGTTNSNFNSNVIDVVRTFLNLNVLINRTKKYNNNGRNETEDQAKEIDNMIMESLNYYNMPFMQVPGNFEGINEVTKKILERRGKELKFKIEPG